MDVTVLSEVVARGCNFPEVVVRGYNGHEVDVRGCDYPE